MRSWFKLKINREVILMGGLLYLQNGIAFLETLSASVRFILSFLLLLGYLVSERNALISRKNRTEGIFFVAIIVICVIFSCLINGFSFTYDLYYILNCFLALSLTFTLTRTKFENAFVDVMTFFAAVGTIIFLTYQIFPNLYNAFPLYNWHKGIFMKNCFVCVVQAATQYRRNLGIFYEPGMFASFLLLALFYACFRIKRDNRKVIILLIGLVTTLSTAGIIGGVFLISALLVQSERFSSKVKRRLYLGIISITIALIIYLISNPSSYRYLINKLWEIDISDMNGSGSGYERFRSVIFAIQGILKNPLFGCGSIGIRNITRGAIATFTPLNWFAKYGFIYGILMNCWYIANAISVQEKKLIKVLLILVLYTAIISQNLGESIFLTCIILYQIYDTKYFFYHRNRAHKGIIGNVNAMNKSECW